MHTFAGNREAAFQCMPTKTAEADSLSMSDVPPTVASSAVGYGSYYVVHDKSNLSTWMKLKG